MAFRLCADAGVPMTPKWHLLLHLASNARRAGNPYSYATFVDEGYNGRLAALARTLHKVTFYRRVLAHFRWAFTRPPSKKLRVS
eukprot:8554493-Lingulodinium_polyedra.AAC.1